MSRFKIVWYTLIVLGMLFVVTGIVLCGLCIWSADDVIAANFLWTSWLAFFVGALSIGAGAICLANS